MYITSIVEEFTDSPSPALLDLCTMEQLLPIAENYELAIPDKKLKESVKLSLIAGLLEKGILEPVLGISVSFFFFSATD